VMRWDSRPTVYSAPGRPADGEGMNLILRQAVDPRGYDARRTPKNEDSA
jgi:hypothetical protein